MDKQVSRRSFLKGAGLIIATAATPAGIQLMNLSQGLAAGVNFKPHAFLQIAPDETVTVWMGQTELGQGTHTGLPMVLADEVGVDWQKVRVKMALAAEPFKDPHWNAQVTGGSTSIRHRWKLLREVGAAAREMLTEAAAKEWGVKASECKAEGGKVIHKSGKSLSFGKLCGKAASLPVPKKPIPKPPSEYKIIGTSPMRVDIPEKVAGKTVFGFDFKLPNMLVATVSRPPAYGAKPESFDKEAAMAIKGVVAVVPVEDRVAVCAQNTWAAMQGKEALNIKWSQGDHPDLNNEALDKWYRDYLAKPGAPAHPKGDAKAALAKAKTKLEALYKLPYLAHATLEPINCTAFVEKNRCRVWAPTQGQTTVQIVAGKITQQPPEKIEVMTPYVGGGFGRKSEMAVVVDAVVLSKIMKRPVKVVWTREDDFKNDFYRPGYHSSIQAGMDGEGRITSWVQKVASPSIMMRLTPQYVKDGIDPWSIEGAVNMEYNLPNRLVEYVMVKLPIPVGFWRSVGNTLNPFAVECFMDELAHAAAKDPLEFRLSHLKKDQRAYRILKLLAEKSGWGKKLPKGHGMGVAVRTCFESTVGHVVEASVDRSSGKVKVHKITGAIDCGTAVFPDAIVAQMEGAAVMGLSVAFNEKIVFADGGVATNNYDDYPLLTMTEVPEMEMHPAPSGGKAGGVGEPPVVTVPPALCNAVFAATGVRLRELPIEPEKLKKA
ncbi:MAG: xanthine dehydrogenase family protein molybdopterin-binding subunit [Desulfarculaceae bacterium]|jgi:isoquinoline 1-oxidoreductase beta subunit